MLTGIAVQDDEATTLTAAGGVDAAYPQGAGLRVALVLSHAGRTESHLILPDTPLVVGRAPPAALCIEDRTLSREHARFLLTEGQVWVEDLGSKNGTFFGGRRVARAELAVGDEIVLGSIVLRVQALGPQGESLDIEGEESLRRRVGEELSRAQQFCRPFALLLARAFGEGEGAALGVGLRDGSWLGAVRARLRQVDRITLYGAGAVEVLLPETGAEEAHRIAQALAAPLAGGGVRLLVGLALYPSAGSTADELFEAARRAAHRASPDRPVASSPPVVSSLTQEEPEQGAFLAGRATRPLLETIGRVAASRIPVIVHGETGTGKDLLVQMIHERGPPQDDASGAVIRDES